MIERYKVVEFRGHYARVLASYSTQLGDICARHYAYDTARSTISRNSKVVIFECDRRSDRPIFTRESEQKPKQKVQV